MIVSHKHKYMFLHCRKTAGSSLKIALGRTVGPSDVVLGGWHNLREGGVPFNRRFMLDLASPPAAFDMIKSTLLSGKFPDLSRLNRIHKDRYVARLGKAPEHALAADVKLIYGREWESYFKFCFVRNPYEMVVSSWLQRKQSINEEYPFHLYLKLVQEGRPHRYLPHSTTNWGIYTIDDKVVVDFVGRFENLQQDVASVFRQLDLPLSAIPQSNSAKAPYNFRDFYTSEEKRLVSQIYEQEIDAFKYTL